MKALLVKSKNGKGASVIACGKVSELNKKIRNLSEFPEGSDLVQLWEKNGGVRRSITLSQFKARASRVESLSVEASLEADAAKVEEAKKVKSEKAKAKRVEKASGKKLADIQIEAIKALSE